MTELNAFRAVTAFLVVLFAAPAEGQLIGLRIKAEAHAKYKNALVRRGAHYWLVCEGVDGIRVDDRQEQIELTNSKVVVVCVPDSLKPDAPLYEGRDAAGRQKPVDARKAVVQRSEFDMTTVWDKVQTLQGLRDEYLRKKDEIETRRKDLAGLKLASAEWFELHRRLLIDVDGLVGWLNAGVFAPAAKAWQTQYGAELKKAGTAASTSRLETAKKLSNEDVPEDLLIEAKAAGFPNQKWFGRKSQHVRMFAHGEIAPSKVEAALLLAERILEQYRTDFIDPFLAPDDRDPVPEGIFVEYLCTLDDDKMVESLWEKFYGQKVGEPRDRRIKMNMSGNNGLGKLHLYRNSDDPEGYVAHTFGHVVVDLAFNGSQSAPAWLGEGMAYWTSFEHLARNSVTCFAFSMPTYAKAAEREGQKAVEEGMRVAFNQLALTKGPTIANLMQTPLVSMESQDLAKAWCVVDWLVATEPKRLQAFFRAACAAERDGRTNIEKLRPRAMEIFEIASGDVYAELEARWKAFAQKTGGAPQKRKS